jgi:YD repeat-containing protein
MKLPRRMPGTSTAGRAGELPIGVSRPGKTAVLALTAAIIAIVACTTGSAAGSAHPAAATGVHVVRELKGLRTANSDTFLQSDGSRVARIYSTPVNYRTGSGGWQPIDDTLQAGADGWHAAAAPTPVTLPSSLGAGAISIGGKAKSISLQLEHASARQGHAAGSSVTYPESQPGVATSYDVSAQSIRETLTLASAAAPTSYVYRLKTSSGLHPTLDPSGDVTFTDSSGTPAYTIAAPSATDSATQAELPDSQAVHYELSPGGSAITLVVDPGWLKDPRRVFPVKIDPDVYFSEQSDCTIIGQHYASSNFCGGPLYVGPDAEKPKNIARSMLAFNLACIPRDALVLHSRLALWFNSDTTTSTIAIDAYGLTRGFSQQATWNEYETGKAWTTAGGDYSATLAGTQEVLDSYKHYWVNWGFTPLVQQWVKEPASNHGILLKAHKETTAGYDEFLQSNNSEKAGEPNMEVMYTPRLGVSEGDVMIGEELANGGEVAVNAANGNLTLKSPDVQYNGEGYETHLTRYYNSLDEDFTGTSFGDGWLLGSGNDTLLYPTWWDGSEAFHEPGGGWTRFDPSPQTNSKTDPAKIKFSAAEGSEAELDVQAEETRTITYPGSETEWKFDKSENGFPQQIVQSEGAKDTVSLSYTESKLTHLADTHGHELTISREPGSTRVTKIESATKELWQYTYNSSHQLTGYKNSGGAETKYGYNGSGLLSEITDASGTYVIAYDSQDRVESLRKIVNGTVKEVGSEDEVSRFHYGAPASPTCNPASDVSETTVTYTPVEESVPYCFDASDHFTGPNTEAKEEVEEEPESEWVTAPEIPAGTCTEVEVFKDCGLAEAPSEEESDLPAEDYGIADNNWILPHTHTKSEEEKNEVHTPFPYFSEAPFQQLGKKSTPGVMRVRRTIPWNMALEAKNDDEHPEQNHGAKIEREDVESWIEDVKSWDKGKGEPVISFERCPKGTKWADPTVKEGPDAKSCEEPPSFQAYDDAMKAFFERPKLAEVKSFMAWNEPNHPDQPTDTTGTLEKRGGAYHAGQFWRVLDDICVTRKPECSVAAGEFSDLYMANAEHSKYFWEYVEGTGRPTTLNRWAWHSYKDGVTTQKAELSHSPQKWWGRFKHFRNAIDHAMKNSTCVKCRRPNIWLTEQGVTFFEHGVAKSVTTKRKGHPEKLWEHPTIAENIMRAYVASKNHLSRQEQVTRFFYYSLRGAPGFDSGLLEATELPEGRKLKRAVSAPREIYRIYQQKTLDGD